VIFVSLFAYALCKTATRAGQSHQAAIEAEINAGEGATWPAFRVLSRLRMISDVAVYVDGSTTIARARCRAAGMFLAQASADTWITIDDDTDAPYETLRQLVNAAPAGIVSVPMWLRDGLRVNIEIAPDAERTETLVRARRTGLGLVSMSRGAIQALATDRELQWFRDAPPGGRDVLCPALFLEHVSGRVWHGEDASFSERAESADVPIWALRRVYAEHAGRGYALTDDDLTQIASPR